MLNKCNLSASSVLRWDVFGTVEFLDSSSWLSFDPHPSVTMSRVRRLLNVAHVVGLRVWAKCFACEMDAGMNCEGRHLDCAWTWMFNLNKLSVHCIWCSHFILLSLHSLLQFQNYLGTLMNLPFSSLTTFPNKLTADISIQQCKKEKGNTSHYWSGLAAQGGFAAGKWSLNLAQGRSC